MKSVYLIILVVYSTYVAGMPSKIPMNPDAMENLYLFSDPDTPSFNSLSSLNTNDKLGYDRNYAAALLKVPKFLFETLEPKDLEQLERNGIALISVNTYPNRNAYSPNKRNLDSIGGGHLIKRSDK